MRISNALYRRRDTKRLGKTRSRYRCHEHFSRQSTLGHLSPSSTFNFFTFYFIFYISTTFEYKPLAMSAQPPGTKAIPKPEAPKQAADPSENSSDADAERLREISAHWNSLKNPRLQPGGYHRGIYIPSNGPPGKFYIGYGRVVEIGLNSQGNT
jgi:hypothetical protein